MRNESVSIQHFSMIPRAEIPRSTFRCYKNHKTTFDASGLVPIYLDEILPGDSVSLHMTAFARLTTPLFPIMDNMYLDCFFFFVPNRLLWDKWNQFMGEQLDPNTPTDYTIPQMILSAVGVLPCSLWDYMGIPTVGQLNPAAPNMEVSALPFRAYNLIYNEWFRDQNMVPRAPFTRGDGPDSGSDYTVRPRGKRHDYFTSCLPWAQKGTAVTVPLGTSAPVRGIGLVQGVGGDSGVAKAVFETANPIGSGATPLNYGVWTTSKDDGSKIVFNTNQTTPNAVPAIYADLTQATAASINTLRQAFQIQKLLERDARGGTRYTEIVRAHFGVLSPDARLQRPEYLGGSSNPVRITPVANTNAPAAAGVPVGELGATGTLTARAGFSQSFTEHGWIIGLANVRADLTYQQGLHKMFTRKTRVDHYWPAFAHLGEQAVYRKELYCTGIAAEDNTVFGYQERWAEYRHKPSTITGHFKSTDATPLDAWHLAQKFTAAPTLGPTFINENVPVPRITAIAEAISGQQFLFDSVYDIRHTRAMPTYSVPGFIDRF